MTKKVRFLFTAALSTALVAMPATAAEIAITEAAGEMVWAPNKAFGSAQLVVTGPNGFVFEHTFAEGETPSLSVFDEHAADGSYNWNLTVVSKISDSLREEMEAARAAGDETFLHELKAVGAFSSESHSGHFVKRNGQLIVPELSNEVEVLGDSDSDVGASAKAVLPTKAQVFATDLIVQGSGCVGFDCATSESFGSDTFRLKENNLRIHFNDTSASASFPSNDWRLTANDSSNGGAERFSIEDATNNKTPFTIEGNSPSHTLYVDDAGRVGVQTNTPAVLLHTKDGNSPALRLEQDGSDGFAAQTWDLAGNETNFFVRDVTNSSKLPLRIKPGAADNSVFIDEQGRTGFGVADAGPDQDLHLRSTDGDGQLLIEETNATADARVLLNVSNTGDAIIQLKRTASSDVWNLFAKESTFELTKGGTGVAELALDESGNLLLRGGLTVCTTNNPTCATTTNYPDYVFDEGYDLMSLDQVQDFIDENGHLPTVPSVDEAAANGIDMIALQLKLLEKVEELTLYTLDQHHTIGSQKETIESQSELIRSLEERLSALEAR